MNFIYPDIEVKHFLSAGVIPSPFFFAREIPPITSRYFYMLYTPEMRGARYQDIYVIGTYTSAYYST